MEVTINPITLDTTKHLARLYPPPHLHSSAAAPASPPCQRPPVLDCFFAADFIPPRLPRLKPGSSHAAQQQQQQQQQAAFDHESYGVKYARYLHQFAYDQYLRHLPYAYTPDGIRLLADTCAKGIAADLAGFVTPHWDLHQLQKQQVPRERILAHAILVQACIEQTPELSAALGKRLAAEFWSSRLPSYLWRSIRVHLAQCTATTNSISDLSKAALVQLDELEVAIELLYLFSSWAKANSLPIANKMLPGLRSVQRVCLAIELFVKYSKYAHKKRHHHHSHQSLQQTRPADTLGTDAQGTHRSGGSSSSSSSTGSNGSGDGTGASSSNGNSNGNGNSSSNNGSDSVEVGKLQRIRLGHKSLLLLEITWSLLLGDEADALHRINNGSTLASSCTNSSTAHSASNGGSRAVPSARSLQENTGLARDALRQIRESVDKYPLLAGEMRAEIERLLPFVHPFDGHLTRSAQLGRFGPIPALKKQRHQQSSALLSFSVLPTLQTKSPVAQAAAAAAAYATKQMKSPSTQLLLADMLLQMDSAIDHQQQQQQNARNATSNGLADGLAMQPDLYLPLSPTYSGERRPWLSKPPRAARECIDAYVGAARMTRSEREYAQWWRRLVQERGMPLSLTMNAPGHKGMNSDITINYDDHASATPQFEFCGIVETEDLPALEMLLDSRGDTCVWPENTSADQDAAEAHRTMYRAMFPLLPALCKALVLTMANWSPAERELPSRQFLINIGPPQVSEATCLGIVKYPRQPSAAADSKAQDYNGANEGGGNGNGSRADGAKGRVIPTSPLSGSNVKRLERASGSSSSSGSGSSSSSNVSELAENGSSANNNSGAKKYSAKSDGGAQPVPAELGARLITQFAQWQAVGGLLMRMMLCLQANHVLQADYAAQLLMNENMIPAVFWWLGTANLDYCLELPFAIRTHTFMAEYLRVQQQYRQMVQQQQQQQQQHQYQYQQQQQKQQQSDNEDVEMMDCDEESSQEKDGLPSVGADPAAVGRDVSDSEEGAACRSVDVAAVGPSIESIKTAPTPSANEMAVDEEKAPAQPSKNSPDTAEDQHGQSTAPVPWLPALQGLHLCLRSLRRLTSHNGLRKGLLYKNKALHFYGRLLKIPHPEIQQIAAELYRDIMPVVSKKQKQAILDTISQVYLHAPVSLNDTFWLVEYALDPQIEMHRHVELLRLLHFYHHEAFGLRLPRDPALFPSLVNQAIADTSALQHTASKMVDASIALNGLKKRSSDAAIINSKAQSNSSGSVQQLCRQSNGAAVGEHSWLLWESDLEDTLNEVYSPPQPSHTEAAISN
ncbi:hypothetical protein BX070DRAFT_237456 [Coemansia spiralis]|nr:hypothetical protein BX070DRAFT_237456 [Coemansia spiralis]